MATSEDDIHRRLDGIQAEAIAARIVCSLLVQAIMLRDPEPKSIFDAMSEAVDKGLDSLPFDGPQPSQQGLIENEKVRELARNYCHQILHDAYRLRSAEG